jgi:hypothetical protein
MNPSASAVFFATPAAGTYEYVVLLQNNSPAPYSIYGLLFEAQFNVPLTPPWALAGIVPVSGPAGWTEFTGYSGSFLEGQTNFQGTGRLPATSFPAASALSCFKAPPIRLPRQFLSAAPSGTETTSGASPTTAWRNNPFVSRSNFCRLFGIGSAFAGSRPRASAQLQSPSKGNPKAPASP